MGRIFFYHMTRTPLEATLPVLLQRSLGEGWSVLLRAPTAERAGQLDEMLWLRPEDGFLPHGRAGGPSDPDHPVLLTHDQTPAQRAAVVSVDGAAVSAAEVATAERVMILFDGRDPAAVDHARTQWRTLTAAGCAAQYWSQESGKWEKKAESGA